MRVRVRAACHDGGTSVQEADASIIRLGRSPECEVAVDAAAYPKVSGVHAQIESTAEGFSLVHLSRSNKTLLNDAPVVGSAPLRVGDRIRLGYTGPQIEILALETGAPLPAASFEATTKADIRHLALLRGSAKADRIDVGDGGMIGREAGAVRFHLDHPHVSRLHASLAVESGRVVLADLGSANGTFVNGSRIARPIELRPDDRIDIGPFSLRFDGTGLVSRSRSNNMELAARGLHRVVKDRASGQPLTLLDDISLVIRPREFVCLLGPSGSGKSTLLAILSGRNPPDSGTVAVNGEDLFAHFEALKEDIAVVPQRDVLHDSLGVEAALRYTAELRLPPDLSREEIRASVADILGVVGLAERRATPIRHLSGGQVKRASLANELVSRPSLLFLDEVTSGLDEQTDREIMGLFRQVADGGKTVVCVTHSLANVEATCHLVVILTEGGRLAFVGTPDEAKAYFEVPRLGDVYQRLAEQDPTAWQARFLSSPIYQRYVADRLPSGVTAGDRPRDGAAAGGPRKTGALRQAVILTRRYVAIWNGDRAALLTMLGQGGLVALLLGLVFGPLGNVANPVERAQRTINLLLLLAVSCFWFGCNTAAKELVKERAIFSRERDFNLRVGGYFASKFLVLSLIGVAQATLLHGIVRAWCGPGGSAALQWLTLATLAAVGTSAGLLISAISRSEEVALALVPIAVIPQIILAGVIAPLSGIARRLAEGFVSAYWGQRALEGLLPSTDLESIGREASSWPRPLIILGVHAAVLCVVSLAILARSRRGGRTR